jgi:hypothetical protein
MPAALAEVAVRVELGDYPFWLNAALKVDRAALDAVAANYLAGLGTSPPQMSRFLFGHVPIAVFDQVFAGRAAAPTPPSTLWLFWVSGYFGGVWLRSEIDRAQPVTSVIGAIRTPPDEATFRKISAAAAEALAAIDIGGDATFDYCEAALLPVEGGGGFVNGLVENFGYNQGYLLQILEQPPAGLDTPSAYAIDCSATLSYSYASPKLALLASLVEDATAPRAAARIATFAAVEGAAVERGRQVWSGGLSVQGFSQESYEQLLDVSSSYLETVHATLLACVLAVESRDAELAANAALANASMNVWLAGYQIGLLEGRDYVEPRFVPK